MEINHNYYSRQIAAIGFNTLKGIKQLKVLLIGLGSLGSEISRHLVLNGIGHLYLYDKKICSNKDIANNYYITFSDVEKKLIRDTALVHKLKKQNPEVNVTVYKCNPFALEEDLAYFDVVVCSEVYSKESLVSLDKYLRNKDIKFIFGAQLGLFSYIFVDFGDTFIVNQNTDDDRQSFFILKVFNETVISRENSLEYEHDIILSNEYAFEDDLIAEKFLIDDCADMEIKILRKTSDYELKIRSKLSGEQIVRKRMFKEKKYLVENFHDFEYNLNNFTKMKSNYLDPTMHENMHICLLSLIELMGQENININDLKKENLSQLIHEKFHIDNKFNKIKKNNEILNVFINTFNLIIPNISTMTGACVAFEVLKAIGNNPPIHQWIRFEYTNLYNNNLSFNKQLAQDDCTKNIYEDISKIFGEKLFNKLQNARVFLIGAGALGCDYLKILAQMGVASEKGCIYVTDMDYIELSNLNRQFLFDENSIGKNKAEMACKKIQENYPHITIKHFHHEVSPLTEHFFNFDFWTNIDLVLIAVDNVKARMYIDKKVQEFKIPCLEAGLLGCEGNSKVIIPDMTGCYSDDPREEKEDQISCTLSSYPSKKEHVIRWAAEIVFIKYFKNYIEDLDLFLKSKEEFFDKIKTMQNNQMENCKNLLFLKLLISLLNKEINLDDFCEVLFKILFEIEIQTAKKNSVNHEDENIKRKMESLNLMEFNPFNSFLNNFIQVTKKLIIRSLSLPCFAAEENKSTAFKMEILQSYQEIEQTIDFTDKINSLLEDEYLKSFDMSSLQIEKALRIEPQIFDKDSLDEANLEFIHYCASIKGKIFNIQDFELMKTKIIAGKIGPVMSQTSAVTTGFASHNIYNIFLPKESIELSKFYDFNFSLDKNFYAAGNVNEKKIIKDGFEKNLQAYYIVKPKIFSVWDRIEVNHPLTLKNFLDMLKEKYDIIVDSIDSSGIQIYDSLTWDDEEDPYLLLNIEEAINQRVSVIDNTRKFYNLKITGRDIKNEELFIKLPIFKYTLL